MKTHDLRGAARLATAATAGLTDLVESMHERIARLPGFGAPGDGRTRGITGLVYRSIRGVTHVVGGSVDALLGLVAPVLTPGTPAALPTPEREALVAALNGVLGDYLAATANPLALEMALRFEGRALALERPALAAALGGAAGPAPATLLVLMHGLCMNPLQWRRQGHDHGALLAPLLGAVPLHLHYNTGLPIAENGRQFAALMQRLLDAWPVPVQRVVLLAHSMGGLVARSAMAQGALAGHGWPARVSDLACLGTPHHGAPLERAGHGLDLVLDAAPYAAPLARLGRVRSAGITDLRHGLRDAQGLPPPLPAGTRCLAVAATLGPAPGTPAPRQALFGRALGHVLGDGLVPLDSALGRHRLHSHRLAFAPEHQCIVDHTGHLDLLASPAVAAQLQRWLAPAAGPSAPA